MRVGMFAYQAGAVDQIKRVGEALRYVIAVLPFGLLWQYAVAADTSRYFFFHRMTDIVANGGK